MDASDDGGKLFPVLIARANLRARYPRTRFIPTEPAATSDAAIGESVDNHRAVWAIAGVPVLDRKSVV